MHINIKIETRDWSWAKFIRKYDAFLFMLFTIGSFFLMGTNMELAFNPEAEALFPVTLGLTLIANWVLSVYLLGSWLDQKREK